MQIKQWEDKHLAHFSYAILSDCEKKIVLIDPSRNPQSYLDYAKEHDAAIIGIVETHPHADFVSGHLELSKTTGAPVYISRLAQVHYPHTAFDEGDELAFGKIKLKALHTPGHSPDSISVLLEQEGRQKAIFTGDTLFIGDCGRPDLREGAGSIQLNRKELALKMYHSLREKFLPLEDDVLVYPAHGAGTLCGKGLSEANSSTMGREKATNWSLQPMTADEFIHTLLRDQPFIPAYFPFDVEINRMGAANFRQSVEAVKQTAGISGGYDASRLNKDIIIIDARPAANYKKSHLPYAVNLMEGLKFETWLGSIIQPKEAFYLAGENTQQLKHLMERAAAIGYETQLQEAFVLEQGTQSEPLLDLAHFKNHIQDYTIVDIRNESETKEKKIFENSIAIPLYELRKRWKEIPTQLPIVVHCAGGYRSAAGSSILQSIAGINNTVYDLGDNVKEFL